MKVGKKKERPKPSNANAGKKAGSPKSQNKYRHGTIVRRGDVVLWKGSRYVVIAHTLSEGFVLLDTIEHPLGFTTTAPADACQKISPDKTEKESAIAVLQRHTQTGK